MIQWVERERERGAKSANEHGNSISKLLSMINKSNIFLSNCIIIEIIEFQPLHRWNISRHEITKYQNFYILIFKSSIVRCNKILSIFDLFFHRPKEKIKRTADILCRSHTANTHYFTLNMEKFKITACRKSLGKRVSVRRAWYGRMRHHLGHNKVCVCLQLYRKKTLKH